MTGRQLKSARKLAGLSQARVERLTGVPRQKIGSVENGNADLTLAEVRVVQRILANEIRKRVMEASRVQENFAVSGGELSAQI